MGSAAKEEGEADGMAGAQKYGAMALDDGLAGVAAADALKAALSGGELPSGFKNVVGEVGVKQRMPPPTPRVQVSSTQSQDTSRTLTDEELKAMRAEREVDAKRMGDDRLEQVCDPDQYRPHRTDPNGP